MWEYENVWEPESEAEHTAVQWFQLMAMYGPNKCSPGKYVLKVPGFSNKQWEQTTVQFPWHCSFLNRCCTVTLLQMWRLKPCSSYLRVDQAGQIRKATNPSSRATNGIWHHPWHPGTVSTVFALGCAETFTVSNKPHLFFELLRGTKLQGEEATLLQ